MSDQNKKRAEAMALMLCGFAIGIVANTAHAQSVIPLEWLDTIKSSFDAVRHHLVWPAILALFFIGQIGLYLKTHDARLLLSSIGTAAGIGIWAGQDAILAKIGYQG